MESVANLSRTSLSSNSVTAEEYNLRVTAPMTAAQHSFNVNGVLEEPPLVLDTLLLDGAPIEGQRNTVSRKSSEYSFLDTPATLTEEMTPGDGEVVTDSLPHGTEAASERLKGMAGREWGVRTERNLGQCRQDGSG